MCNHDSYTFTKEGENDDGDDFDGKKWNTIKKLHQILYTER